ncbi:MAG: FliH/SctL family protein [Nitrospirae bacterium]|nr:FliH/SctL family protein [Nitrospirota bacterium]MCL5237174.1 FliH/SctL family protein [Nitrospirota bacterium]
MEKKLLFSGGHHLVQPYTLTNFEDDIQKKAGSIPEQERPEVNEEDIQSKIKELELQGYEKGRAAGYAKGIADGGKEAAAKLERIGHIISGLENYKEKKTSELLPAIIELSLDIAKKIVHKEIELDKNIIMFIAKDAVKKVSEKEESITIKVNPLDYEVMISNTGLLKEQSGMKNISIEPMATISPGGCYIETRTGEVDARIEEQLKEIQDAISTTTDREM